MAINRDEIIAKLTDRSAYNALEEFMRDEAWYLIKEYDRALGVDSGIGDEHLVFYYRNRVKSTTQLDNFNDIVGNVLGTFNLGIDAADIEPGTDIVEYFAEKRLSYSSIPFDPQIANQGQKLMLTIVSFNKFLEELGGEELKQAVMKAAGVGNFIDQIKSDPPDLSYQK